MANWCWNELTVRSNNVEQLRQFVQHIGDTKRGSEIGLEKLLPVPEELYDAPNNEDGTPAAVVWKIKNWGSQWEFRADASWISDNCIKYVYMTKWWPALGWIKYAAHLYPDLEFTLDYYSADSCYYGIFKAHGMDCYNEIHEIEPDPEEEMCTILVNQSDTNGESQIQGPNLYSTMIPNLGNETDNKDADSKPKYGFESVKFD